MKHKDRRKGLDAPFRRPRELKISIMTHYRAYGPGQALLEWCVEKGFVVVYIAHPLKFQGPDKGSKYQVYRKKWLSKERELRQLVKLPHARFAIQFIRNLLWGIRLCKRSNLVIGVDPMNAFAALILRRLGVCQKVVYYAIDYTLDRFPNKLVNELYHRIDGYCALHCDETWNLSSRMIQERNKRHGLEEKSERQKIVPMGAWLDRIPQVAFRDKKSERIAFVGHLLEKQGLQVVLEALEEVIREIPSAHLLVIGDGPYKASLIKLAKKLRLSNHVTFTGFISDHRAVEQLLSTSAVGVALYDPELADFTYYSDPGKIKLYLACGLPVIMTAIPHNARELEEAGCGFIVEYESRKVAKLLIQVLKDPERLKVYAENARRYARQFDWGTIFSLNVERALGAGSVK